MDTIRKLRAAPSPIPTTLRRSHDSLVTDTEQVIDYYYYYYFQ